MTSRAAIIARMAEDARRIAAETDACLAADLMRLGWRIDQVRAAQAHLAAACAALEAEIDRARDAAVALRPADLSDMDIAFGIEGARA
jgi:N-acyl-L-homoserine lactone synthetase